MDTQEYQLTVVRGPEPGKSIPLTSVNMTIGRDPMSEITINDPEVSRRHAQLVGTLTGYQIQDLGSTNGTFVDGVRLSGDAVELEPGQVITIGGGVELVYEAVVEVDAQAETVVEMDAELPELPQRPETGEVTDADEGTSVEAIVPPEPWLMDVEEPAPGDASEVTEEHFDAYSGTLDEETPFEESEPPQPEPATSYDADDFATPVVIPHDGEDEPVEEERPPVYRRLSTIIAAVLLLILCCCCGFLLFFYYVGGDWLLRQMGMGLP